LGGVPLGGGGGLLCGRLFFSPKCLPRKFILQGPAPAVSPSPFRPRGPASESGKKGLGQPLRENPIRPEKKTARQRPCARKAFRVIGRPPLPPPRPPPGRLKKKRPSLSGKFVPPPPPPSRRLVVPPGRKAGGGPSSPAGGAPNKFLGGTGPINPAGVRLEKKGRAGPPFRTGVPPPGPPSFPPRSGNGWGRNVVFFFLCFRGPRARGARERASQRTRFGGAEKTRPPPP